MVENRSKWKHLGPPGCQGQAEKSLVHFWTCSLPYPVPTTPLCLTLVVVSLLLSCIQSVSPNLHTWAEPGQSLCSSASEQSLTTWPRRILLWSKGPSFSTKPQLQENHLLSPSLSLSSLPFWISPSPLWVYVLGFEGGSGEKWTRFAEPPS